MIIKGLNFLLTCSVCPEQYDVGNEKGDIVGYVRLRHGELTCSYPYVGGETIYLHYFDDNWMGRFDDDEQRMMYLNIIAEKIINKVKNETI